MSNSANKTTNHHIPILALLASVAFLGCASEGLADELQVTCDMSRTIKPNHVDDLSSVEVSLSASFNQITMRSEFSATVINVMRNGDREQVPPGRYWIYRVEPTWWQLVKTDAATNRAYLINVRPTPHSRWSVIEIVSDAHNSNYPPAKPGALVGEPLKAAEDAARAASSALIASRALQSSIEALEPMPQTRGSTRAR